MRYFSLGQQKILIALALFILALLYFKFYFRRSSPPEGTYQEVVVEILGEVQKPGIYIFKNPPALIEAVEKAGGLKENVLLDRRVFSEIIETGTLMNVAREPNLIPPYPPLEKGGAGEILERGGHGGIVQNVIKIKLGRMEARKLLAFSIPLDLNRISAEDLCLIPGIGESLAKDIVSHRERRKGFRSVEDLKNVKGIGDKKWKELRGFFVVR
jgi:competence protein ComEA